MPIVVAVVSHADHMYRMSMMTLIATDSGVNVNRCWHRSCIAMPYLNLPCCSLLMHAWSNVLGIIACLFKA